MWDAAATWKFTVEEFDKNHDNQIQRGNLIFDFYIVFFPIFILIILLFFPQWLDVQLQNFSIDGLKMCGLFMA